MQDRWMAAAKSAGKVSVEGKDYVMAKGRVRRWS
jgi:ribosome-binding ATPase YchF (GTP1/OBG family)